jgi:hypothetical protein
MNCELDSTVDDIDTTLQDGIEDIIVDKLDPVLEGCIDGVVDRGLD